MVRKMNTLKTLLFMVCTAGLFLAGCARPERYETVEQICVPNLTKAEAMQAAEEVLAKMHFTVAKADAEQGIIRSRPLTGAQFFEFWRRDNVGAFNRAEANLHSIRRTVELDISRQDEKLCIGCDVKTQRLSIPERQVSSTARAYEMFSISNPSMQRLELHSEQRRDMVWVDLGRDARLETEILKRIERQVTGLQKEKKL